MNFRILACSALLASVGNLAWAQAPQGKNNNNSNSAQSTDSKYEVNVFYGQTLGINPTLINQKIEDMNAGATILMRKIEKTTMRGGEALTAVSKGTLMGVRFTRQTAQTPEGTESGKTNKVELDVQDISGVIKFRFQFSGLNMNVGATGGASLVNDLTITDLGVTSKYTSPGGMVFRGFIGMQMTLSILSLWGEAGYQSMTDKAYKRDDGVKPTSTAGEVTLNLTGPYALVGVGLNF